MKTLILLFLLMSSSAYALNSSDIKQIYGAYYMKNLTSSGTSFIELTLKLEDKVSLYNYDSGMNCDGTFKLVDKGQLRLTTNCDNGSELLMNLDMVYVSAYTLRKYGVTVPVQSNQSSYSINYFIYKKY